jgi:hypothetical protein
MSGRDALPQRFFEIPDRIFQVKATEWRRDRHRAVTGLADGVARRTISLGDAAPLSHRDILRVHGGRRRERERDNPENARFYGGLFAQVDVQDVILFYGRSYARMLADPRPLARRNLVGPGRKYRQA